MGKTTNFCLSCQHTPTGNVGCFFEMGQACQSLTHERGFTYALSSNICYVGVFLCACFILLYSSISYQILVERRKASKDGINDLITLIFFYK